MDVFGTAIDSMDSWLTTRMEAIHQRLCWTPTRLSSGRMLRVNDIPSNDSGSISQSHAQTKVAPLQPQWNG